MNPIQQYLADAKEKPAQLARRIGCSPSTITRILKGERRPSVAFAEKVEKKTKGKLKASDFLAACLRVAS